MRQSETLEQSDFSEGMARRGKSFVIHMIDNSCNIKVLEVKGGYTE